MASSDKGALAVDLRKRLSDVKPLLDEEDFFQSDETLMRFLKARDWKVDDAEKMLRAAVEWRRVHRPLHGHCMTCLSQPGFHSMRQVGFDEMGRPVVYSSFSQCTARQNNIDDVIEHVTYLIENATKVMKIGVMQWVFVIDCAGLSLNSCNPKLGHGVSQVLADNYPERLGTVICVNHNPIFQGVWNAIRIFLHPSTTSKVHLVRSKAKVKLLFDRLFSEELSAWLLQEIRLNKKKPLSRSQREFWSAPLGGLGEHDPRGCPSYVAEYIESYPDRVRGSTQPLLVHRPHPNIVEDLSFSGRRKLPVVTSSTNLASLKSDDALSDGEDDTDDVEDVEIGDEFQIPANAPSVQM